MVNPEIKVENTEQQVFEKIKNLKMETKHERARDDLVIELRARDDAFDDGLEQYGKVKEKLIAEAEDWHQRGYGKIQDLLENLFDRRKTLDWLTTQKEQAYLEFIKKISKGEGSG